MSSAGAFPSPLGLRATSLRWPAVHSPKILLGNHQAPEITYTQELFHNPGQESPVEPRVCVGAKPLLFTSCVICLPQCTSGRGGEGVV